MLIDDRSTDNSKEICVEYSKKDNRIVLLENNSESHGPGPTRNVGLDYATGEYIYFMDADDWIDDCLLQCAINRMQETNADIVQFGVVYERNDGKCFEYHWNGKKILTRNEIRDDFRNFEKENRKSLWMYLFCWRTVNTIRFDNIISGEDVSYVMDALGKCKKIAYISSRLYHYRYVEGSTSHRWNKNIIVCRAVMWNHQRNFLESLYAGMNQLVYAEAAYDNYIWAIYHLCSNLCPLSYKEKRKELLSLEKHMRFNEYRKIYPLKLQHGLEKIKYMLVKYRLEKILLLFGPVFLRIVRGE